MYIYEEQKKDLFTDEGQRKFLKVRDHVHAVLKLAGAIRAEEAMKAASGDSWQALACIDRLIELSELREIPQADCSAQHRIFVSTRE